MEKEVPFIKYTIGFCIVPEENKILMVYRKNSPNRNKWNGLGGKVNYDIQESHEECIIREMLEETEELVDLKKAKELRYVGLVTWDVTHGEEKYSGGMYAYVAEFQDKSVIFEARETREGRLEWLDIAYVLNKENKDVVENVPLFLTKILSSDSPRRYHCTYQDDELVSFETYSI